MNSPAGESQAHRMDAAANVKGQRSLFERVEQVTVGDANRDRHNEQPGQKADMPAGVSENGGPRRRWASSAPRHGTSTHKRVRCLSLRQRMLPSAAATG